MKVLKFGGTSVGTAESLANVKKIVEEIPGQAIVVVSALGGLTDRLIATARMAAANDPTFRDEVEAISSRHFNIIPQVVEEPGRPEVISQTAALLSDLKRIYEGIFLIRHLPQQTLDMVVSFGERISSIIVTAMIAGASRFDSLEFIKTEKWFGKNIADQKLTESLIKEAFNRPFDKAVVPGFISTDRDSGEITNLGRGGSDFTAALIAAALDADILEIWTDVDGFMTADPRIVAGASVVPHMSFVESMQLCSFGAKVIYPPTIYPVFHKNIPIKILNTFNPTAPGTLISDTPGGPEQRMKGVTALRSSSLLIMPEGMESRALNALARQGIKTYPMTAPGKTGFCLGLQTDDARPAMDVILNEFAPEISNGLFESPSLCNGLATVAVVGENMKADTRIGARIRNSLERLGIEVAAFSERVSDTTLSFMVDTQKADEAVRYVHNLIF